MHPSSSNVRTTNKEGTPLVPSLYIRIANQPITQPIHHQSSPVQSSQVKSLILCQIMSYHHPRTSPSSSSSSSRVDSVSVFIYIYIYIVCMCVW
mmetsp:Transcript_35192/g.85173  ORF Transcript_35192/g.85173 Transcript_35192/m.85173 type:complete len:94 (+) Transcript_35192:575-856(+)